MWMFSTLGCGRRSRGHAVKQNKQLQIKTFATSHSFGGQAQGEAQSLGATPLEDLMEAGEPQVGRLSCVATSSGAHFLAM